MNKTNDRRIHSAIDKLILLVIGGLLLLVMYGYNAKVEELRNSRGDLLFIGDADLSTEIQEEFARSILEFRPDVCKMIEVFDSNFDLIFRVQFMNDYDHSLDDLINYPDLIDLFMVNQDGHTVINFEDGMEEYVYFRWSEMSNGDMCLVIVYMSHQMVFGIWTINIICFIILLLVIVLIIRTKRIEEKASIERYKRTSIELQDRLIR